MEDIEFTSGGRVEVVKLDSDSDEEDYPDLLSRIGVKKPKNKPTDSGLTSKCGDISNPINSYDDEIFEPIPMDENEDMQSAEPFTFPLCSSPKKSPLSSESPPKSSVKSPKPRPPKFKKTNSTKEMKEDEKKIKQTELAEKRQAAKHAKEMHKIRREVEKDRQKMMNATHCETYVTTVIGQKLGQVFENDKLRICMDAIFTQSKCSWEWSSCDGNFSMDNYIQWKRKIVHFDESTGTKNEAYEPTSTLVVVLPSAEFLQLINRDTSPFVSLAKQWTFTFPHKSITVAIVGPGLHSKKVVDALTDVQLLVGGKVQHRVLDNVQELCHMVKYFHRAVSLAPRKQLISCKAAKELDGAIDKGMAFPESSEEIGDVVEDWFSKMLMQIPNLSLTMAQVITSEYKSVSSLLQAYEDCENEDCASVLLKDLDVQRGDGRGKTSRKFGPQMSKRVHQMLTAQNGLTMLR